VLPSVRARSIHVYGGSAMPLGSIVAVVSCVL
jgi:hypothetical protein